MFETLFLIAAYAFLALGSFGLWIQLGSIAERSPRERAAVYALRRARTNAYRAWRALAQKLLRTLACRIREIPRRTRAQENQLLARPPSPFRMEHDMKIRLEIHLADGGASASVKPIEQLEEGIALANAAIRDCEIVKVVLEIIDI